jgi:DNA-binding response OmpR family regulator
VKQSGGHIWAYSEPEHGATFKVYLPRVGEVGAVSAPEKVEPELPRGAETVLLVEDEAGLREMVRECLEASGYTVLEARQAAHALEIAQAHAGPIHLLMTDVVMPGVSGRNLAQTLTASHPETTVLYMSGYTDDAVVLHGVLAEDVAFLQKPFTIRALVQKVREVLDQR